MKGKKILAAIISAAMFTSCAGTMGLGTFAEDGEVTAAVVTGTFGGHTYIVVQEELTPIEAQAVCEELGGYLASVTSQEEQDFIAGLCKQVDYDSFWIGGSDDDSEGEWYWLNGEPWDYTNWYPGGAVGTYEPNNGLGAGDDYAAMNRQRDYMWIDAFGGYDNYTAKLYFVLEKDGADVQPSKGEHKYQVIDKGMTWDEAEAYCESLGGHLATITSQEEQDTVSAMVVGAAKKNYWLGGYKNEDNELFWITGEDFVYSSWGSGEPNNSRAFEDKVMMWSSNGLWNDLRADGVYDSNYGIENLGFICEWDGNSADGSTVWNGHKYQVIDKGMTWTEAEKYCESLGGHLVTITSKDEDDFIINDLIADDEISLYFWIGGTDSKTEGTWEWVSGEEWDYTHWLSGQPNDYKGWCADGQDYVMISNDDGEWEDCPDDGYDSNGPGSAAFDPAKYGFICEWDGISGKTVRSAFEKISGMDFDDKEGELREDSHGVLGWTRDGAYAVYKNIDFGEGADTFTFNGISSNTDNYIELHIDSADGKLIGTCQVDKTGAWGSYVNYSCEVTPVTGVHDLYLVFRHNKGPNIECCEVNWFVFSNGGGTVFNGHRYQRFDKGMTWTEAEAYCESLGGHLVTITSEEEENKIEALIANGTKDAYWLGGRDKGLKLTWITGEDTSYTKWGSGQPDNYEADGGDCVSIFRTANHGVGANSWADMSNTAEPFELSQLGFICEWDSADIQPSNGEHKYQVIDKGMTWDEAEAYCESLGGHLVTITSEDEQKYVESLIKDAEKNSYWIGFRRQADDSFAWVTGEKNSYSNWKSGNPNNSDSMQYATVIFAKSTSEQNRIFGEWNDLNGNGTWEDSSFYGLENIGFICEWDGNSADSSTVWNGHKYKVFDDGITWKEAKEYCESIGGHLVTITSEDEEKFVENLIDKYTKITYHIGLTDDGKKNYSWVTGETFDYNNDISSADAQSSQYTYVIVSKNADEKYLHIWADHDDVLRGDMWDYTKSGFVCEWDDNSISSDGFDAYKRIQGEDYDDDLSYGLDRADITNPDAADSDGGVAGWINTDSYAIYNYVNFGSGTPAKSITVRASNPYSSPVDITVYRIVYDTEEGAYLPYEVGTVTVEPTGSWNSYKTFSANISDTTGDHLLSLYFNGSVNLDWFTFSKTSVSETAEATLYGDANLDGKVTVADAVAIMQHIGNRDKYGLKPQGLANADVDGAAGVTGKDALVIQQVDAKMYKQTDLPLKAK